MTAAALLAEGGDVSEVEKVEEPGEVEVVGDREGEQIEAAEGAPVL